MQSITQDLIDMLQDTERCLAQLGNELESMDRDKEIKLIEYEDLQGKIDAIKRLMEKI